MTARIAKIPPVSRIPPVKQNHEENQSKTTGDNSGIGDIIPPTNQIPPVENHQNHAQKSETGDTGGIGGILPTHIEGQQKRKATEAQAGNECDNGLASSSSSGESSSIYRLGHSDTFVCYNCKQKGDKWFMQKHLCTGANGKLSLQLLLTMSILKIRGSRAQDLHPQICESSSVFHNISPYSYRHSLRIQKRND